MDGALFGVAGLQVPRGCLPAKGAVCAVSLVAMPKASMRGSSVSEAGGQIVNAIWAVQ